MGKLLQPKPRSKPRPATKKTAKRAASRSAAKKTGATPTLRQLNGWLTRNRAHVLRKAKENTLRLIGRETL